MRLDYATITDLLQILTVQTPRPLAYSGIIIRQHLFNDFHNRRVIEEDIPFLQKFRITCKSIPSILFGISSVRSFSDLLLKKDQQCRCQCLGEGLWHFIQSFFV